MIDIVREAIERDIRLGGGRPVGLQKAGKVRLYLFVSPNGTCLALPVDKVNPFSVWCHIQDSNARYTV